MDCLHSFGTKNKLESHKKVCEDKDFCSFVMSFEDTKILDFNQYQISDKIPSVIYPDLKTLLKRIDGSKNNFEKSSITKVGEYIPCEYSMSMI